MRHPLILATGISAGLLLAACNAPTPAPSTTAATPPSTSGSPKATAAAPDDAAVQGFLTALYGPSAKRDGEWKGVPVQAAYRDQDAGEREAVTRQVCEDKTVTIAGVPSRLLAVCGRPDDFGHPTPGLNDFFLLQAEGGRAVARAQAHLAYGSMGQPGDVDAVQLGPDLWGFAVDSGFTNMGQTTGSRSFVIPRDGAFHDAGFIRTDLSNAMAEDCDDGKPCTSPTAYDIEFDIQPDRSAAGPVWPLQVRESGHACGTPATAQHRVEFDAATQAYRVPRILKREGCADDWNGD